MATTDVMATPELIANIEAGNLRKSVSELAYIEILQKTYDDLKSQYGDFGNITFDPEKHLTFFSGDPLDQHKYHATRRLTMEELGLTNKNQISPIGVSDPFPLFTEEATDIMKLECLHKETFLEHARSSFNSTSGMDCILRGYVKRNDKIISPFIYAAWTHPKTVELISTMAGVELEVIMDYEIAQVNIGYTRPEVVDQERIAKRERTLSGLDNGDDIPAIVGWHYDSYPFVCVLMLSDTTNMIGGETYLRMGDSKIARVSGPQKGSAAVLQGRLIQHLAPKPFGATERMTMVTSYRAKNSLLNDGSVLSTVKPEVNYGSVYNAFYPEWVNYRVEVMKNRLENVARTCKESKEFNKKATVDALKEIEDYLASTFKEMEISPEEWTTIASKG